MDDLVLPMVTSKSLVKWKPPQVNPSDIAIVYFTSGSTGKPKAVPQRHESIVNCILGSCNFLKLSKNCRCLQALNIGFDASLLMLFIPLSIGGTLVLPGEDIMKGFSKTDTWLVTPSMLQAVGGPEQYSCPKTIVVGGEPLSYTLAKKWSQAYNGQLRLINNYGPTETTIASHIEEVDLTLGSRVISIGRTIPNVQCYILDGALHLVPIGVIGEICIGGIGVCHGYLYDEQRSQDLFVANPYGPGLIYRTGDLGCWLPDGRVYCVGRKDDQVKIRGFRVELGEIEQVIRSQSATSNLENACVAYDRSNDALVGYVTPSNIDCELVLSALSSQLPSYMVPDHIIPVDKLPLTTNGKVDRQALLTNHPPGRVQSGQTSPSSLTTPTQQRLIAILCELFNLKQGEIRPLHDTFFTLGGNSISAMYFVSRCKANGIPLAMADINRRTTVAALAKCASEGAGEDNMNSISTECTHGPFSLTPVQ
ncbi:hypothetical protein IWQ62_006414, partial [Dispira parvispora]